MKIADDARHCRVRARRNRPASLEEFNETLAETLREAVANDPAPSKTLARLADRSHRTAAKWLSGEHAPHVYSFFRLAQHIPALRALALKMLEVETLIDPEFEARFLEAMRAYERARGRKG